tara:strand:+ start:733 stop:966 length:234 start_codon:yes stop_codon:yes gene_type:complete
MLNKLENKSKMKNDNLKINQNEDGSFTVQWDKEDPDWKWMNDLTTKELEVIIEQAVKLDRNERSKGLFSGKFRGVGE